MVHYSKCQAESLGEEDGRKLQKKKKKSRCFIQDKFCILERKEEKSCKCISSSSSSSSLPSYSSLDTKEIHFSGLKPGLYFLFTAHSQDGCLTYPALARHTGQHKCKWWRRCDVTSASEQDKHGLSFHTRIDLMLNSDDLYIDTYTMRGPQEAKTASPPPPRR